MAQAGQRNRRELIADAEREATHGNMVEAFRMVLALCGALLRQLEHIEAQQRQMNGGVW